LNDLEESNSSSSQIWVSTPVLSLREVLKNVLNFRAEHVTTPLYLLPATHVNNIKLMLRTFRNKCITPSSLSDVPNLTTYIEQQRAILGVQINAHSLSYDTLDLQTQMRPRPSLKRTSSSTTPLQSSSKKTLLHIASAIGEIVDVLNNLKQKLESDANEE
jgi:hypothetical protein